jgi:aspartate carbamoyltransferase catalytic subunit
MPKHLVWSKDLKKDEYEEIVRRFHHFLKEGISPDLCRGKVVATLFFQPSTRTMNCFQSAMLRAGGGWIGVMGDKGLSMEKGETLEETIREYSSFADCIVLRHPDDDSAERAAAHATVPLINGGSGSKEHAVGSAMILCTLEYFLKRPIEGTKIGIYGTPQINRATKAMVPILGMFGVELYIDDLGHFPLPPEVEEAARKNGVKKIEYTKLEKMLPEVDILLVTRGMQKGIIENFPKEKEGLILKTYKPINLADVEKMKKDSVVYMLKPRIFEIEKEVDDNPRARSLKEPEPFTECALAVMTYLLGIKI